MILKSVPLDTIQKSIISSLALVLPLIVMPDIVDNEFETPKRVVFLTGSLSLALIYIFQFFIQKKAWFTKTSTPWVMALLCFLITCNFFYTHNPFYTIDAAVLYVAALIIFFCVSIYISRQSGKLLFTIIAIVGTIVALISILQSGEYFLLFKYDVIIGVIPGTIGNSNSLGAYLIFPTLVISGSIFLLRRIGRFFAIGMLYILLLGLYISRARASWIGFIVSEVILIFLLSKIHGDRFSCFHFNPHKILVAICIVGVFIFGFFLLTAVVPHSWRPWLKLSNITDQRSLAARMKMANASYRLWRSENLWTGTGLGSFRNRVYDVQSSIAEEEPEYFDGYVTPSPRHVHNEYLEVLNDGGLIAALALLLLVGNVMVHGYMLIGDPGVSMDCRVISAIAFSTIVGILLTAFFYFPFRITTTLFMTVLMLGIMEGLYAKYHSRIIIHGPPHGIMFVLIGFIFSIASVSIFYHTVYIPLKGEHAHTEFKSALARGDIPLAETYLQTALVYSPFNTLYCFNAANFYMDVKKDLYCADFYIERAISHFNGDISRWGLHFIRGILNEKLHRPEEARRELIKAIQYYPPFDVAKNELTQLNKAIERAKLNPVTQ